MKNLYWQPFRLFFSAVAFKWATISGGRQEDEWSKAKIMQFVKKANAHSYTVKRFENNYFKEHAKT